MANKKAKTKSGSKTAKKATVTKVVSAPIVETEIKPVRVVATKPKARFDYMRIVKIAVPELIGTFVLTAAFMFGKGTPIIMVFAAVAVMLGAGRLIGSYFNPLLSFGAWINRRNSAKKMLVQIVAQILGSMLAFLTIKTFVSQAPSIDPQMAAMYGVQGPSLFKLPELMAGKEWFILLAELIAAFVLSFFIARDSETSKTKKALTYGGAIFVALFVGTGMLEALQVPAVVNPAIALALQVLPRTSWLWTIAIYFIAPLVGGALGYMLADIVED